MPTPRCVLFTLLWLLAPKVSSPGQVRPCPGSQEYEMTHGIEIRTIVVNRVWGRAVRQDSDGHIRPDEKLPGCLSLFTADSHRFVSSTTIDPGGRFDFGAVPTGSYRLIARSPGFGTGNVPVKVVRSAWHRQRRLLVLFRLGAMDEWTTADYDRE